MNREMTLRHLAEAEGHATLGERHLAQQHAIFDRLERDGHEADKAVALLATLRDTQRLHLERRDRLIKALWEPRNPKGVSPGASLSGP